MTLRIPALAATAAALMLAAAAHLAQHDPMPNRDIVLEGDPGSSIAPARTDARGRVEFTGGEGRYYVLMPDAYTLRVSAVARVEMGRTVLTSTPILPGSNGRAWFMGRDGRRLTLTLTRGGPPVRITLTEGPPVAAAGPRR